MKFYIGDPGYCFTPESWQNSAFERFWNNCLHINDGSYWVRIGDKTLEAKIDVDSGMIAAVPADEIERMEEAEIYGLFVEAEDLPKPCQERMALGEWQVVRHYDDKTFTKYDFEL